RPAKNRPRRLAGHSRRDPEKRPRTLTADNQMMRKPNLALNAEIESMAERLMGMVEASVSCARCPHWVRGFHSHHAPHAIQSAQPHPLPPIFPHARQKCQANQGELRWLAGPRM